MQWFAFRLLRDTSSSAIAERPARRRGSAHAKYSMSHRMIIEQFLLLGCSCNTDLDGRCHQELSTTVEKYGTHWPTKLTVPETISRSRDMVGAHQNLNGPRNLSTPVSGMVFRP